MAAVDTEVARLKKAYAALGEGDESAAPAMLAPDCEWRESAFAQGRGGAGPPRSILFLADFLEPWGRRAGGRGRRGRGRSHRPRGPPHGCRAGERAQLDTRYAHVWTMRGKLGVQVDAYRDPAAARSALAEENQTPAAPNASDSTQNAT